MRPPCGLCTSVCEERGDYDEGRKKAEFYKSLQFVYIGDKIKIVLYMCIISKYSGDKEEHL